MSTRQPVSLARQLILYCFLIALLLPFVGQSFVNTQVVKEQHSVVRWFGAETAEKVAARANAWYGAWAINTGLYGKAMTIGAASGSLADKAKAAIGPMSHSDMKPAECEPTSPKYPIKDSAGRFNARPCESDKLKVSDSAGRFNDQGLPEANAPAEGSFAASAARNKGKVAAPTRTFSIEKLFKRWVLGGFGVLYFAGYRMSLLLVWLPMVVPALVAIMVEGEARRKLKLKAYGGVSALRYRVGIVLSTLGMAFFMAVFFAPGALPPVAVPAMMVLIAVGIAMWTANMMKTS